MSRKITVAKTKTTAAEETLYVVPTGITASWYLLYLVSTVSTESPTVRWYDKSKNVEYTIFAGKNLGAGEYVLFSQAEVILQPGDEIRILQASTNSLTYIVSLELIQDTTIQQHNGG